MNLLTRLRRGEPEISRLSFNDVIQLIAQKTSPFAFVNGPVTYTGRRPSERVENSFKGYIDGAYKVNPIVFGIMTKRASVLSEARFAWREKVAGKPGDIYYDDALSVLENPWPNGTTGELIARMIQDVDLAGNCYIVNEGDRLRRLRPDWVQIVLTGDPLKDLDVDVYGYLYTAGGPDSGGESKAYLPSEMCHWSPSPDPDALYRGMSWITPVIREIMADQVAVTHKLKFFENGAVLGPIITAPPGLTISQFQEFVDAAESAHRGAENAYKTLYLAGGTDVTLASANMQQMDFSGLQGKTETRLCVAANMPASIAGVSEGLQGSSLNAGNYGAAKREWADTWLRPTWRSACAALSTIVDEPDDADLWYDECDITFLHEDQQDAATIAQLQMSTIVSAITGGFEPDAAVITVNSAWKDTLKHSGLVSVQLTPPGQGEIPPPGGAPVGPAGGPSDLPPIPPGFEPDATVRALLAAADMLRATQSQNTGNTGGSGSQTAHEPAGSSKGGQFTANPGGGSSGYKSILPPDSGYKSGGSSRPKAAAAPAAPQNTPQPPATPRTMKVGDSGEDVRYAQYGLSLLGFNVAQDGQYGPETEAAVKEMQARLGVKKPNGHLTSSQLRQIQTAVRLSPCIGRSEVDAAQDMFDEIMRAFEDDAEDEEPDGEGDIADEDEVDQDEGDAEVVDAVLEALDLAESGEIEVARAHDVSGELRIPGGVGGGRWTKSPVTAAILDALKGLKPDDKGDPFVLDGKPIEREPLRKAAVARGITLKRGASRDDIVKALLDDVGKGEKAAPSAPSPRADAKAKYAAVAQSRPYASAAAAIAELTGKKQSNAVIAEHVRAIAHPDSPDMREITNAADVNVQLNAIAAAFEAGNPALGKRRMTALLKKHGITQVGAPGKTEPFNPATHEHLGDVPAPGTPVSVVRPGMSLHRGEGDHVQLSKAVVMSAPGKAPAKAAKKAAPKASGLERVRQVAASLPAGRGKTLAAVGAAQGIDGKPKLGSAAEVDKAIAGGWTEAWRGVRGGNGKTAAQLNDQLRTGDYAPTSGNFGDGYYFSVDRRTAEAYRGADLKFDENHDIVGHTGGEEGGLARVAISPSAKIVDFDQLQREQQATLDRWRAEGTLTPEVERVLSNPGTYAAAAGYDAIRVRNRSDGVHVDSNPDQYVVLNRGAMLAERPTAPKAAPSNPAAILASLPADLTPAQQRARLRSKGVPKEEIDALVPLAPRKSAKPARAGGVETAGATSVAALPRTSGPVDHHVAAKATNPHFGSTADGSVYRDAGRAGERYTPDMGPLPSGAYEENCTNVVQAFEMRMRGYDVQAAPLDVLDKYGYAAGRTFAEIDQQIEDAWRLSTGKPHGRSFKAQKWRSFDQIDKEIEQWPEGGRGTIFVGKHIFSVVKVDGSAQYIEAQFGKGQNRDVTAHYRRKFGGVAGGAKLIRLDDLVPADGVLDAVRG